MRGLLLIVLGTRFAVAQLTPDLIVVNAKVWTGNPARQQTQAIAVRGIRKLHLLRQLIDDTEVIRTPDGLGHADGPIRGNFAG